MLLWDFSHIGYNKYEEGVSIITKHKIEEDYFLFVSRSNDKSFWKTRKVVGSTIKINETFIDFYSCHLGWYLNKNDLRLDLILVNKEIKVKYSRVIFNGINKPIVSDHYGVEIEL